MIWIPICFTPHSYDLSHVFSSFFGDLGERKFVCWCAKYCANMATRSCGIRFVLKIRATNSRRFAFFAILIFIRLTLPRRRRLPQTCICIPNGVDNLSTSSMTHEAFLFGEAESSRHISEPTCCLPWLVEFSTMFLLIRDDAFGKCNCEFWCQTWSQTDFPLRADREPVWNVSLWYSCGSGSFSEGLSA